MNKAIFHSKDLNLVESRMSDTDGDINETEASVSLNPSFVWTKFVLTDDKPNENKQRVPKEEFSNLIKSGIFAPVKMSFGQINENHDDAFPIGVITHLKEQDDKILGIAALWSRERQDDVLKIRDMVKNGDLPQLSWEILFENSVMEETGVESLANTVLRGITLVSMPAYAGRTPIYAAASKNTNSEDKSVEDLEKLQARVAELEQVLAAKDGEIASLTAKLSDTDTELSSLREFKSAIETEKALVEKLTSIKQKFSEAGLVKTDSYFEENKENLLGMTDPTLDFLIQEMVAFSSKEKEEAKSSKEKKEVPVFGADSDLDYQDPKKLAEMLRKSQLK